MGTKHRVVAARWVVRNLFKRGAAWKCRVRDGRSGRVFEVTARERDRRRAEQHVLDWIKEREDREDEETTRGIRFDVAYAEFLSLKILKPSTEYEYRSSFEGVLRPAFKDKLVDEIELADVERFLRARRERSSRTNQKHIGMLRSFFRWARRRKYCREDPTDGVRVGRSARRAGTALTVEEARRLLQACRSAIVHPIRDQRRKRGEQSWKPPAHLFLAVLIALHTGLRRGNIVRLRWEQIDLAARKIRIDAEEMKANADLIVPVHPELAEALTALLRNAERMNPRAPVLGLAVKEIKGSFKRALKRAGLPPIRWHDLRHTFATWLSSRTSFAGLRQLLGHSAGAVTLHYTHVPFEELSAVVNGMPRLLSPAASAVTAPPVVQPTA